MNTYNKHTPITFGMLIGSEVVDRQDYHTIYDPACLDNIVGRVALGSVDDANETVEKSFEGFHAFSAFDFEKRAEMVGAIVDVLEQEQETITNILVREQGMLPFFIQREIQECIHIMRHTIDIAKDYLSPQVHEDEETRAIIYKKPFGVILAIVPWNAPMVLTLSKVVPALLAGNSVVVKPSINAPLGISYLMHKVATLFPKGTISVIYGGKGVSNALTAHHKVRKISFTGGNVVATQIMKSAADSVKGVHFELGGNDPAIVLEDIDIKAVVESLKGSIFGRSGQFCFATKRVYVQRGIYQTFVQTLCEVADAYQVGHPLNPKTSFGPVNNQAQYEYIHHLIKRSKEQGATVYEQGKRLEPELWDKGYYIHPTIVADVDNSFDVVRLEQFGPIIPIIPFDSDDEVIALANDSEMGLSASVWSGDQQRATAIANGLECGRVYINNHRAVGIGKHTMPFGGVKQSGIGWEHGVYGLYEFIQYHSVNGYK